MKKTVVKFGGSNLKSRQDLARLIRVIKAYNEPLVIVISALYGITDLLIDSLNKIMENREQVSRLNEDLQNTHQHILDVYIDNEKTKDSIILKLKSRIKELNNYLLGIHYFGEIPDFARDMILSYGERLSSLILVSVLNYRGIKCFEALPENIGLITNGEFHNASVNFKQSTAPVSKAIASDRATYIIPGFYGISPGGKVTLLGRGGSDYSAASLARCINAKSVDFWKDVSGYMSVDPKLFADAVEIKRLSYREAAELSYFGAKILHPRTFEPVIDKGIPLRLFNINLFCEKLEPITIIENKGFIKKDVVKSVTFSDDVGILKLQGPGVGIKSGIMAKVTTRLSENKINIKSIITSQTSINILLGQQDLKPSYKIVRGLEFRAVEDIVYLEDISLIAIVGEGMLEKPGIAARAFSAVSSHQINVLIISAGASPVATYFIIDKKDKGIALKAIHDEFFVKRGQVRMALS